MRARFAAGAVHALGKAPAIEDDGRTMVESGAIIQYLIDRYGACRLAPPREAADYVDYLQWLHYAEGSAIVPMIAFMIGKGTQVTRRSISGPV